MPQNLLIGIIAVLVGFLGLILPYKWNILRPKRWLRKILPEKLGRMLPKIFGTLLIVFGTGTIISSIGIGPYIIRPTERTLKDGNIQFAYVDKKGIIRETNEIPLIIGTSYGWTLLCTKDDEFVWKEELILPDTPQVWGDKKATSNTYTTNKVQKPRAIHGLPDRYKGIIGHTWKVVKGDPEGIYTFKITINDKQYSLTLEFKKID